MEILHAIILGIIEGLTEFLPVSSTGHLLVAEELLGYRDTSRMFTVIIQMGAIAAVLWYYRRDLWDIIRRFARGDSASRRFVIAWVAATVPAGIAGLLLGRFIERWDSMAFIAWALIAGGVAMWLVETYHQSPKPRQDGLRKITTVQAVKVGLFQVLALIPGVSRSGATIIGGLLSGLDRVTATAFSFYLGIPILMTAAGYKLATGDVASVPGGSAALVVGLVASFITAFVVVGWLLAWVSRHDFKPFAYYRIVFGFILLLAL